MKKYETIDEIVKYILNKHKGLRSSVGGVTAYKMIRKPDGSRITFEETRGFKIIKFDVSDNYLTINQLASGYEFRGQKKHVMSSNLFLQDLVMINVFDYRTEFLSRSSIDFAYIVNEKGATVQMLHEWINDDSGIIRAQWVHNDEHIERILDEISIGRRVEIAENVSKRHLNLNFKDF